ncbi:MAG: glycosyltransferase family 39 protein [Candidatus Hydrogenedentota bacterium]|nr:MAG: glycosyltransferase family 39 protein [Candidatus Hydrogenedentota bacterium]
MSSNHETERHAVAKRILKPAIWVTLASVLFLLMYRHLVTQAFSQGFVLEEVSPLMNAAIDLGRKLYWFGGRPLFAPSVLALLFGLAHLVFSFLIREPGMRIAADRWLLIIALSFSLMYVVGGTNSFALYLFSIMMVPALGWLGQCYSTDAQLEAHSSTNMDKIILAGIILFGLALRLYQLDVFPRMYTIDEQLFAKAALEIGDKEQSFLEEPAWEKTHLLRIAAIRLTFSTLGVGLFQHRTVSAIEGALCILLVYLLCQRLWGNRAGIFAAFLLAVDSWHMGNSRLGVHFIEGPLLLLLLLHLTIRAVRIGGRLNFAILGAAIGATSYLYQSCYIMAPFAAVAALLGRCFVQRVPRATFVKEWLWTAAAFGLAILPHLTFGRASLAELFSEQTMPKNFLSAARDYHFNPAFMLFVNSWRALENIIDWTPRLVHPSGMFYSNPMMVGIALIGLGILLGLRKNFENVLILSWIPVAFLPIAFGYGFADRRIFVTLAPIPPLLAALPLARLWNSDVQQRLIHRYVQRGMVLLLLVAITLVSLFIVYEDSDPLSGGAPHPRKAAEFIRSIVPSYTVLISNQIKDFPFLLYLTNYETLHSEQGEKSLSVVSFETLWPLAEKIATTPGLAVVVDPGTEEERFFGELTAVNPRVEIVKSDDYWACLVPANG